MVLYRLHPVRNDSELFVLCQTDLGRGLGLTLNIFPPRNFAMIMCKWFASAHEHEFGKIFVKRYSKNTGLQFTEVVLDHQMCAARDFILFYNSKPIY